MRAGTNALSHPPKSWIVRLKLFLHGMKDSHHHVAYSPWSFRVYIRPHRVSSPAGNGKGRQQDFTRVRYSGSGGRTYCHGRSQLAARAGLGPCSECLTKRLQEDFRGTAPIVRPPHIRRGPVHKDC